MPCSGRSIATTAKPCAASVPAIANASVRLRVMPCLKITTGQPVGGFARPEREFGSVTTIGTVTVDVATGNGLQNVMLVEVGSSPKPAHWSMYAPGAASQCVLSGAVGLSALGAER